MDAQDRHDEHVDSISVLKARARALAQKPLSHGTDGRYIEVVEFMLAEEKYAIELKFVREVYPLKQITPLPGTPAFICGIINVRGEIVSVVDLKKLFELPDTQAKSGMHVVIAAIDEMEFGILADHILGETKIVETAIQKSLPTLTGIREKYLKGVADGCITVLDGGRLLTDKSLYVYQEMTR